MSNCFAITINKSFRLSRELFTSLAKTGEIATYCQANAIMTLKEYAEDYARPATREAAKKVIDAEIPKIVHEKIRKASVIRLKKIEEGERDFRF